MTVHIPIAEAPTSEAPGINLDAGAVYDLANKIGWRVMEMHLALHERRDEEMQRACADIATLANSASVLAAHLERKIGMLRRRHPHVRS